MVWGTPDNLSDKREARSSAPADPATLDQGARSQEGPGMKLVLQKSQKTTGMVKKTVTFELFAQSILSEEEKHNVETYRLGPTVIYNSENSRKHLDAGRESTNIVGLLGRLALAKMSLNVSVNSLMQGQTIPCSSLEEVIAAEAAIKESCENLKGYLEIAATFDGRREEIDYS
jgi:hypothetical protein